MPFIQKINAKEVLNLRDLVSLDADQVNSRTLVQRPDMTMTLFAVATDQEIGGHSAVGDALVNVLSGVAEVTIEADVFTLKAGESIVIPANSRHSLYAVEGFQMLLVVVKPEL
ncbi:cupin domain-containing protein [Lacticaseibacillus parakribbianus]|uniref:cupin domain-containing protein n=1 Tax=Lacticaseibacillus parakribbianus TaxID=2970927 RepID=UPI0021CB11F4|nr:cupin domain-containing protein [Lacticaseibacillus parakribbianus]